MEIRFNREFQAYFYFIFNLKFNNNNVYFLQYITTLLNVTSSSIYFLCSFLQRETTQFTFHLHFVFSKTLVNEYLIPLEIDGYSK